MISSLTWVLVSTAVSAALWWRLVEREKNLIPGEILRNGEAILGIMRSLSSEKKKEISNLLSESGLKVRKIEAVLPRIGTCHGFLASHAHVDAVFLHGSLGLTWVVFVIVSEESRDAYMTARFVKGKWNCPDVLERVPLACFTRFDLPEREKPREPSNKYALHVL